MSLNKAQLQTLAKAKLAGSGGQGVALDDRDCTYLIAVIVTDLGLQEKFPELAGVPVGQFFEVTRKNYGELPTGKFLTLFERLLSVPDAETYFANLARLLKTRLKYQRILETQSIPTVDQVGPRGLLQYGVMSARALIYFMFWRKWIFDIDNRAGQETGYLFEPIIASAIGGISVSASASPIRRRTDPAKGRQVDCIVETDKLAYEIKLRVTIAASGQGRWQEELDFPEDCQASGYKPMLLVLDPTPDPKLSQLAQRFEAHGGKAFTGPQAWQHLDEMAGPTMARFLERYVRAPIQDLLNQVPADVHGLPELSLLMTEDQLLIRIAGEQPLRIPRTHDGMDAGLAEQVET